MSKVVYLFTICLCSVFVFVRGGDPIAYDVHPIKHGHHYYDAYYHHYLYKTGIITYFAFLAIKVKIALVLGAFFVFFMFAGKLFALIKYSEYSKEKHHDHYHEPEKVYVQSPPIHYDHSFPSHDPPDDLSHRVGVDKFWRPRPWPTRYNTLPSKYLAGGRAMESEAWRQFVESRKYQDINSISNGWETFTGMVKRLNVTDVILNKLGVKTAVCKKRFVCELDQFAKRNWVFEASLKLLRDNTYEKYETKAEDSKTNCEVLYKECNTAIK